MFYFSDMSIFCGGVGVGVPNPTGVGEWSPAIPRNVELFDFEPNAFCFPLLSICIQMIFAGLPIFIYFSHDFWLIFFDFWYGCGANLDQVWLPNPSKSARKARLKTESKVECVLASILKPFWWPLDAKLAIEIHQKSIQKGIEKRWKKEKQQDNQKSRSKNSQPRGMERVRGPGEVSP